MYGAVVCQLVEPQPVQLDWQAPEQLAPHEEWHPVHAEEQFPKHVDSQFPSHVNPQVVPQLPEQSFVQELPQLAEHVAEHPWH